MRRVSDERKAEVLRLRYVDGLSTRAIAKRLSMARRTVRSLLGEDPSPRAIAPAPRPSILDPFDDLIRQILADTPDMRAPSMLERLRQQGYTGGISVLRERMRQLRPQPLGDVFSTFVVPPGKRLEVDWAHIGFALPGVPRRVSAFVAVLPYSRMLYLDFALSQQMGSFLRCLDRALSFFGGRTEVEVFDNMKTVVLGRTHGSPIFHERFVEYARVRGFAISATWPRRPTDKPFVERGIGFIRSRFLPGRRFADFDDLCGQGTVWRDTFANAREHETTGRVPALVFEHEERATLAPLRDHYFDVDDLVTTGVDRRHRIHFDRNDYTVPWRFVGQTVLVRGDDALVRVLLGPKQIAQHPRSWTVREVVSDPAHEEGMREHRAGRRPASMLPPALDALGDVGARYFAILAAGRRSLRAEQTRLVLLVELFGAGATASAIEEVMRTGHVGADYVEYVMRHKRRLVASPAPLRLGKPELDQIHVTEPDLAAYDDIYAHPMRDPGDVPTEADA